MTFQFLTATKIVFGRGTRHQLGDIARSFAARAIVVTGATPTRVQAELDSITAAGLAIRQLSVSGEPSVELAQAGVALAREHGAELVVAIGGGSAIDAGKAIAALMTNPGDPLDYLEVVGRGLPLKHAPAPFVAVPTTAGTGAEVTKNAVLSSSQHGVKVSLRSDRMLPDVALVDSELTHSVGKAVTAATGLDALTQVLEPYVSCQANPLTDALCLEALRRARGALPRVFANNNDAEARDDMALVSLFGGLALANAKLGAVHGFAGPLGGMYNAPHGALCARLLPEVMQVNAEALTQRDPTGPYLARYQTVAAILCDDPSASIARGIKWVQRLCDAFGVPRLTNYGVAPEHFSDIVAKSQRSSSMKGNPIRLNEAELRQILSQAH